MHTLCNLRQSCPTLNTTVRKEGFPKCSIDDYQIQSGPNGAGATAMEMHP